MEVAKKILETFGVNPRKLYRNIFSWSIRSAIKEQGLIERCDELRNIIPNISDQYTSGFSNEGYENYFEVKMRGLYAFQVNACVDAVDYIYNKLNEPITIVDIGDSSGHHLRYLNSIISEEKIKKSLSVNLDPVAIEKINMGGRRYFV